MTLLAHYFLNYQLNHLLPSVTHHQRHLLFGDDLQKHLLVTKTKLVPKLPQLIKVLARTQGSLATPVTSSQKTGKATVNELGNTKVWGTRTKKPSLKPVEQLPPTTSTVSSCSLLYTGEFRAGNIANTLMLGGH